MKQEENAEFRKDIEAMKETDSNTKMVCIDIDLFFLKLISMYRILVNRAKTYVINAFAACDLDGN